MKVLTCYPALGMIDENDPFLAQYSKPPPPTWFWVLLTTGLIVGCLGALVVCGGILFLIAEYFTFPGDHL